LENSDKKSIGKQQFEQNVKGLPHDNKHKTIIRNLSELLGKYGKKQKNLDTKKADTVLDRSMLKRTKPKVMKISETEIMWRIHTCLTSYKAWSRDQDNQ